MHDHCIGLVSGQKLNRTTFVADGGGQYVGFIGETCFAIFLEKLNLKYSATGKEVFDYDFVVSGLTFDVKTKSANRVAKPYYHAHVSDTQKHFNCDYYVFASVAMEDGVGVQCDLVGWIRKSDYWNICRPMTRGQKQDQFTCPTDACQIQFSELNSMHDLAQNLLVHGEMRCL